MKVSSKTEQQCATKSAVLDCAVRQNKWTHYYTIVSKLTRVLDVQVVFLLLTTKLSHGSSQMSYPKHCIAAPCFHDSHCCGLWGAYPWGTETHKTGVKMLLEVWSRPSGTNTRQAGMPYSEFETHLSTKQGAPESCPLGNTWAQDGSVTPSWQHPAEERFWAD